jgi:hypothetical protein
MPDNDIPSRNSDEKALTSSSPADRVGIAGPTNPIAESTQRTADFSERQREKFAPEIIDMSPSQPYYSSTALASSFVTHVKYRVTYLVMTGAAGDRIDVSFSGRRFSFYNVTGAVAPIPFPYEIDRGTDIVVRDFTTPASVAWTFMIYGYPE